MATIRPSLPHESRTASEPRDPHLEPVTLSKIAQINDSIRLLRLTPEDPGHTIKFQPGQWLDTFLPGLEKAGGFTITSTPAEGAQFVELAVQRSGNPPAKWFWRDAEEILGRRVVVRVGGAFIWPPPVRGVERLVLVAGGVGVNPLMSIFAHLIRGPEAERPREIHFVYGTKAGDGDFEPEKVLFLTRLMGLCAQAGDVANVTLRMFLTGKGSLGRIEGGKVPEQTFVRRIGKEDLVEAVDGYRRGVERDRRNTVCYVCGPPRMTDETVEFLKGLEGMKEENVLCEKWW